MGPISISAGAAILPSVILLYYFYKRDLHPEPRHVIAVTFFLGICTAIPVLVVGYPGKWLADRLNDPYLAGLVMAFAGAAIPEELFKFLVVTRYAARHRAFDEPMDGIIYMTAAGIGFATAENIRYFGALDGVLLGVGAANAVITTIPPKNVVWNGNINGDWNSTTPNWQGALTFVNGDAARFDDSAAGTRTVNVPSPVFLGAGGVTVSNAGPDYTFTGTGLIAGTSTMIKDGAGGLSVDAASQLPLTINGGSVSITAAGVVG